MITKCKNCGWEITDINLSDGQRLEIWKLIDQDQKLFAVKKMRDDFGISHASAKVIVAHLNKFGKCHKCGFDELKGEYVECPKCKSFNYNVKI